MVRLPGAQQRLAWLAEHLDELAGSGIIYTLTVAAAREVAEFLRDRGHLVAAYTGQDDHAQREAAEDALLGNQLKALVATSALGMGFDKPDLGFIVHLGAPQSPIAYYQQIGRAGRGVDRADVILLPGREDADIWAYFASLAFPPEPVVRATLAVLADAGRPLSTAALETRVDLTRSRLEMMLKVLDVDGAVRRVSGGWTATGQDWAYDADRYAAGRGRAGQRAAGHARLPRHRRLPHGVPAPRAGRPGGRRRAAAATTAPAGPGRAAVSEAGAGRPRSGCCGPASRWRRGRCGRPACASWDRPVRPDPAAAQAQPGRASWPADRPGLGPPAARACWPRRSPTARSRPIWSTPWSRCWPPGTGPSVRPRWSPSRRGPAPSWSPAWPARSPPSAACPTSARSTTPPSARLGDPGPDDSAHDNSAQDNSAQQDGAQHNSAQRLRVIWPELILPEPVAKAAAVAGGPILLVDDRIETGWTMTVAAKLLRDAGAPAVLPLALASSG